MRRAWLLSRECESAGQFGYLPLRRTGSELDAGGLANAPRPWEYGRGLTCRPWVASIRHPRRRYALCSPSGMVVFATTPARREAILDAALRCFSDKGYEETTIDDIREASGASIGSIYHHFGDKLGIAASLYKHWLIAYQRSGIGIVDDDKPAEKVIKEGVAFHLRWVEQHRDAAHFVWLTPGTDVRLVAKPGVRELNERFFGRLHDWLAGAAARGELLELRPDVAIALWIGPVHQLAREWLHHPARRHILDAAGPLGEGAWRALRRT